MTTSILGISAFSPATQSAPVQSSAATRAAV